MTARTILKLFFPIIYYVSTLGTTMITMLLDKSIGCDCENKSISLCTESCLNTSNDLSFCFTFEHCFSFLRMRSTLSSVVPSSHFLLTILSFLIHKFVSPFISLVFNSALNFGYFSFAFLVKSLEIPKSNASSFFMFSPVT